MRKKAEITVFISLIFVCMCALICSFVETARTAGTRWYLQLAVNSSMDSLFSQYHRTMWEEYHLFGLEYSSQEEVESQIQQYLNPYLEAENWYPLRFEQMTDVSMTSLVDDGGIYFQQEILDYMKYGIWTELDITPEGGESLLADIKEAQGIYTITSAYNQHTKEAVKLELVLEDIAQVLNGQAENYDQAVRALDLADGDTFLIVTKKMQTENQKIPQLVDQYQICADDLYAQLEKTRMEMAEQESAIRSDNYNWLWSQLSEYESYVTADGERRQEIEHLLVSKEENDQLLEQLIEEAIAIQEYIDEWEADEEDDELNEEKLWRPVKRTFQQFHLSQLSFVYGVKDKEKQRWLEAVGQMADLQLLSLVLPEGAELSKTVLPLEDTPSKQMQTDSETDQYNLVNRVLVNEYCYQVYTDFLSPIKKEVQYEIEYLIAGKERDDKNLEDTILKILAVREGLNFIHLLLDSQKREEARTLAALIAGVTGLDSFISVITCFILVTWALGESIMDLRSLLDGGKIPLLKDRQTWQLSLDQLLDLGKDRTCSAGSRLETGFDYHGYLKLLLLLEPSARKYYRMMDMIQINIGRRQKGFLFATCLYRVDIEVEVCGKHLFSSLGFVENVSGNKNHQYKMNARSQKTY